MYSKALIVLFFFVVVSSSVVWKQQQQNGKQSDKDSALCQVQQNQNAVECRNATVENELTASGCQGTCARPSSPPSIRLRPLFRLLSNKLYL